MTPKLLNGQTLDAYLALARDVAGVCPHTYERLRGEILGWDSGTLSNLHRLSTVYLPKLGKWFDKCLSKSGLSDPPPVEPSAFGGGAPFVGSLFPDVDLRLGVAVTADLDPTLVFMARQLFYMKKKFVEPWDVSGETSAIAKFVSNDELLRTPRSLDTGLFYWPKTGAFSEGLKGDEPQALKRMVRVLDLLARLLVPQWVVEPGDVMPRHGPGAVSDVARGVDKYDFVTWPSILETVFPRASFVVPSRSYPYGWVKVTHQRPSSRLIAVPKTYDKPRLIASEPVAHQFLQQGLMRWIRDAMSPIHRVMVDFSDQSPSRELALQASADGRQATVDLRDASDRMSLWAVESLFQGNLSLFSALLSCRTPIIQIGDEYMGMKKFAPMGSAVTFPVQSLLYATAALAAVVVWEGLDKRPLRLRTLERLARQIRVFGDDLIVPGDSVPYLCLILDYLQLQVNPDKTHVNGFFRESCGMDAYKGYDVTPAYMSCQAPTAEWKTTGKGRGRKANVTPSAQLLTWVEQSNHAHAKGLWHLAAWMADQIPAELQGLIAVSSEPSSAVTLATFSRGTASRRWRYSSSLHRWEVRVLTLRSKARTEKRNSPLDLLQYFLEGASDSPDPIFGTGAASFAAGVRVVNQPKYKVGWVDARADLPTRL